jgi:metal-responsive CopG/Arc/MetJ family transcriptional regulator
LAQKVEDRLETLNVRLPDELLAVLDGLVDKGLFSNRSEAIREFLREYVLEHKHVSEPGRGGKHG